MSLADLKSRIEVIEETYELMLGYAAQGLEGDEASKSGGQLRDALKKAVEAIEACAPELRALIESEALSPADSYNDFAEVIERDAKASAAAVNLVLAQESISSQLVDNLNASIHVRALLTDLFVIDEILKRAAR